MGDFDGDGKTDIVWRDLSNGDVHVWLMNGLGLNPGSGFVRNAALTSTISGVGDYDGDGRADILWRDANQMVSVWFMSGPSVTAIGSPGSATVDWQIVRP